MSAPLPDRFTCEQVFARIDDYLDRELSADETRLVKEHLATCEVCAGEYAFEGDVLETLRRKLRRIQAPADLRARVAARIDEARRGGPSGPAGKDG